MHGKKGTAVVQIDIVKAVLNCLMLASSLDLWWLTSNGMYYRINIRRRTLSCRLEAVTAAGGNATPSLFPKVHEKVPRRLCTPLLRFQV
jgi:hypothetical protein